MFVTTNVKNFFIFLYSRIRKDDAHYVKSMLTQRLFETEREEEKSKATDGYKWNKSSWCCSDSSLKNVKQSTSKDSFYRMAGNEKDLKSVPTYSAPIITWDKWYLENWHE